MNEISNIDYYYYFVENTMIISIMRFLTVLLKLEFNDNLPVINEYVLTIYAPAISNQMI